jgi:ABC-type Fe3+-hydroxamate transport system substrate-binding protein
MKRTLLLAALAAALLGSVAAVRGRRCAGRAAAAPDAGPAAAAAPDDAPRSPVGRPVAPGGPVVAEAPRLVAFDPGLAETLCMLGLGGHLVARTSFTDFPAALTNLPVVLDAEGVDLDALAAAKPDFAILPEPMFSAGLHKALMERRLGHFTVRNATLSDYYQCVYELAVRFGAEETARIWLETMNEITGEAAGRVATAVTRAGGKAPSFLVVLGRSAASPDRVLAAGRQSFHQGFLDALALPNACPGEVQYAEMSLAEAAALHPDVIVEIRSGAKDSDVVSALSDWIAFPDAPAVRARAVHVLSEPWALRAGPRIDLLLSALADYAAQWAENQ